MQRGHRVDIGDGREPQRRSSSGSRTPVTTLAPPPTRRGRDEQPAIGLQRDLDAAPIVELAQRLLRGPRAPNRRRSSGAPASSPIAAASARGSRAGTSTAGDAVVDDLPAAADVRWRRRADPSRPLPSASAGSPRGATRARARPCPRRAASCRNGRRGSARPPPRRAARSSAPSASSFSSSASPMIANRSCGHVLARAGGPPRRPRRSPSPAPGGRRARPRRRRVRTRRARRAPRARRRRRPSPDRSGARSMPLPSSVSLRRGHAEARQRLEVLGVLHELGVRAELARRARSQYTAARRGQRILALRVQAVHRVHDHRHAREPRRDPAVEAGLRVVGVHDRRAAAGGRPTRARRAPARPRAGANDRVAWRSGTWRMPRASSASTYGPGRRDADDLEARGGERLELRAEQQLEADVGRGHVRDAAAGPRVTCRPSRSEPGSRAPERVLERHPARELPLEELHPVADLDRRAGEPVRIGARRQRVRRACRRARPSGSDRARAASTSRRAGARAFGYAKSSAAGPSCARRSGRSSGRARRRRRPAAMRSSSRCVWVCEPTSTSPVAHASRSADHESGRPPPGNARPPSTNSVAR